MRSIFFFDARISHLTSKFLLSFANFWGDAERSWETIAILLWIAGPRNPRHIHRPWQSWNSSFRVACIRVPLLIVQVTAGSRSSAVVLRSPFRKNESQCVRQNKTDSLYHKFDASKLKGRFEFVKKVLVSFWIFNVQNVLFLSEHRYNPKFNHEMFFNREDEVF